MTPFFWQKIPSQLLAFILLNQSFSPISMVIHILEARVAS
jgi:hypothetical protein